MFRYVCQLLYYDSKYIHCTHFRIIKYLMLLGWIPICYNGSHKRLYDDAMFAVIGNIVASWWSLTNFELYTPPNKVYSREEVTYSFPRNQFHTGHHHR